MKRKILNLLIALICVPALMLCGCSKKDSDLPKINASVYFEESVEVHTYNNAKAKTIEFAELIAEDPDPLNIDCFTEIKVTAKNSWVYKMYIDCIYFYVYANEDATSEMVVNVTITNLVDEDKIGEQNAIETVQETCSLIPQKDDSILCKVDVKKTVATATGCTITFDINNSINGTVADDAGKATDFRWMIYGLEFYAEHRAY